MKQFKLTHVLFFMLFPCFVVYDSVYASGLEETTVVDQGGQTGADNDSTQDNNTDKNHHTCTYIKSNKNFKTINIGGGINVGYLLPINKDISIDLDINIIAVSRHIHLGNKQKDPNTTYQNRTWRYDITFTPYLIIKSIIGIAPIIGLGLDKIYQTHLGKTIDTCHMLQIIGGVSIKIYAHRFLHIIASYKYIRDLQDKDKIIKHASHNVSLSFIVNLYNKKQGFHAGLLIRPVAFNIYGIVDKKVLEKEKSISVEAGNKHKSLQWQKEEVEDQIKRLSKKNSSNNQKNKPKK